jgi:two-component system chemotaxis sensor kinase CheA
MKTRMQPIGSIWSKFPRVVRDLSNTLEKQVRIEMEGEDTELDKTLIEAIKDPLTHVIRNAVDHGLESPEDRRSAGKNPTGVLKLRAYHEGGQVIVEVSDDGKGLDIERIKEKALSKGLISADRADRMSDREAANLIFRPGFSTAEKVTNVSGRGVGMDVVRTNVEKIGGVIDVVSQFGKGTTLTLKIPLTLAIIPALIISTAGDRYLIPQVNLVEVLHVDGNSRGIERAGQAEVFRLRGRLLPIVHLAEVLGFERPEETDGGHDIVVLQAEGRPFGLVVNSINDTEEIVVKPLSPHLKSLSAYAGTTIMGDGAVALILDAIGIARQSGVIVEGDMQSDEQDVADGVDDGREGIQTLLVCMVGEQRVALPLATVARLEEFDPALVERAAGRDVLQYRGGLLNLYNLREVLNQPSALSDDDQGLLQVLVYESGSRTYGLIVDEILDVFEADLTRGEPTNHAGLSMSGVVGQQVTDLLDLEQVIEGYERRMELV